MCMEMWIKYIIKYILCYGLNSKHGWLLLICCKNYKNWGLDNSHTVDLPFYNPTSSPHLHYTTPPFLSSCFRLRRFHRVPLDRPIRCVAFAYMNRKFTHILVGCEETDPNHPSLMIVVGRDADPKVVPFNLPFGKR